jgi:hypothetical protein
MLHLNGFALFGIVHGTPAYNTSHLHHISL